MRRILLLLAAICLLCTACAPTPPPNGEEGCAFYVKDGELMVMTLADRRVTQVTSRLKADNVSPRVAAGMRLSDDDQRLFYLDHKEEADGRYLFMRELSELTAAPTELDRVDDLFEIAKDGNTVLYLQHKDAGGYTLWMHDLETATLITDRLNGFGFTANGDLPYYSAEQDGETVYVVLAGEEPSLLTAEEFEAQTGGRRSPRYAYDGVVDLRSMGALVVDGKVIDKDYWYSGGMESYFDDRMLYFEANDREGPYTLKQYIKGGRPQTIDAVHVLCVGYTTDGAPLYLQNLDVEKKTGELMMFRDGCSISLDSGVSGPVSLDYIVSLADDMQRYVRWE